MPWRPTCQSSVPPHNNREGLLGRPGESGHGTASGAFKLLAGMKKMGSAHVQDRPGHSEAIVTFSETGGREIATAA